MRNNNLASYIKKSRDLSLTSLLGLAYRKIWKKVNYHLKKGQTIFCPHGISEGQFYRSINITGSRQELAKHFLDRKKPCFLWNDKELEEITRIINKAYPQSIKKTIKEANRICRHKFDLLGSGEKSLGEYINWHKDFKCGFVWQPKFYMDIEKVNFNDNSDIKVPWELSRFHHLVPLGKAYLYTKDEKYSREFISQVSNWIDQNPVMIGVNWVNTMEVAIRVVNWIFGYYFFRRSSCFTESFCAKFLRSLLEHGRFIVRNLELRHVLVDGQFVRLNSNHYMSNIVGLLYVGLLFPEFKDSKDWLSLGISELFREILNQNNADGVNYELSINYHRLVTELCLSAIILCMKNQIDIPANVLKRLEKMVDFTAHYIKPDGYSPLLGDADDGRLHILSENDINDHRYLLVIASILFKRDDFKALSGRFNEEALWLLGPKSYYEFKSISDSKTIVKSKSFPLSGFYVMRKRDLYMIITCNDSGIKGTGSHGHNDCLSFELSAFHETFFIDSGTHTYTGNIDDRNKFRSTMAHNTIMIDEEEINRIPDEEVFRLENDARPIAYKWITNEKYDYFEGAHFGYSRFHNPVTHRRQIFFDKQKDFWVVKDSLEGSGIHNIDCFFHLAPGISPTVLRSNVVIAEHNNRKLLLYAEQLKWNLEIIDTFVSESYGKKRKSKTLRYSLRHNVPVSFFFMIVPLKHEATESYLSDLKSYVIPNVAKAEGAADARRQG